MELFPCRRHATATHLRSPWLSSAVRPASLPARPASFPSRPSVRPSIPLRGCPPCPAVAAHARAGRGAPRGAALRPRGREGDTEGDSVSARTAGRAPWTAWGGRWQAPGVARVLGREEPCVSPPGCRRARAPEHLPVGDDALPADTRISRGAAVPPEETG